MRALIGAHAAGTSTPKAPLDANRNGASYRNGDEQDWCYKWARRAVRLTRHPRLGKYANEQWRGSGGKGQSRVTRMNDTFTAKGRFA
jgi:hypothetical protein